MFWSGMPALVPVVVERQLPGRFMPTTLLSAQRTHQSMYGVLFFGAHWLVLVSIRLQLYRYPVMFLPAPVTLHALDAIGGSSGASMRAASTAGSPNALAKALFSAGVAKNHLLDTAG